MSIPKTVKVLLFSSGVSVGLFIARSLSLGSRDYWYLNWNLFLAWLPLIFSYLAVRYVKKHGWLHPKGLLLLLLWLAFLPNSFYIATDFIHLLESPASSLLFDIVMLVSFTFNGFLLGYVSTLPIHHLLIQRLQPRRAHLVIATTFLLCSFAIYLGRYLRWNTWDIVSNPLGLLFDVSERFLNPASHEQTFRTTGLFFVLISAFYIVLWQLRGEKIDSPKR